MSSYPAAFDPVPINPQIQQTQPIPSDPFSQVAQIAQQQATIQTQPQIQPQIQPQPQKTYKYFPAPPVITTYNKYQDVNNDPNLQHTETLYFLDKTLDWIKYDKSFKKISKIKRHIKGQNGYEIIYKILKLFVKRGNTNWYDLKMQEGLVKDYIKHKLNKIVDN
jgi:hypothetical protein